MCSEWRLRRHLHGPAGRPLVARLLGGDQWGRRAREACECEASLVLSRSRCAGPTSEVLARGYPFLAEERLGIEGALIGHDAWSGRALCVDPWELYQAGIAHQPQHLPRRPDRPPQVDPRQVPRHPVRGASRCTSGERLLYVLAAATLGRALGSVWSGARSR